MIVFNWNKYKDKSTLNLNWARWFLFSTFTWKKYQNKSMLVKSKEENVYDRYQLEEVS